MRWFPFLLVVAVACHDPEELAPAPGSASITASAVSAIASERIAKGPSAKPHDDDAESPLKDIGEGGGIVRSSDRNFDSFFFGDDPRRPTGPKVRAGDFKVTGRLPPEVIKRIVRQNFLRLGRCYQPLLINAPTLTTGASTTFTITAAGSVIGAKATGEITDKPVLLCIEKAFSALSFPQPEGGIVKVVFPVTFGPPEYKFTIGDKNSISVTEADLVKALEAAGYKVTGAASTPPPSGSVSRFKAEKGGLTFSITLDPEGKLPVTEYSKLKSHFVSLEDGSWGLFVESTDKVASQALVDAISRPLKGTP